MITAEALEVAALELVREQRRDDDASAAPTTDEELADWVEKITGHHIPARAVCDDHQAPFQFVADMFFHRISDAIVLANRAGGKTESTAALHLANARFKPGFETSHIGAIQIQASRCYRYYRAGLRHAELRARAPDPHIRETSWSNGAWIEILPGTESQTQGSHPHLVSFDELDQGRRQSWENSKSMPVPYRLQKAGQYIATSTRQSSLGLMQRALDEAAEAKTPLFTWCVFETMKKCEYCVDVDSGEPPVCALWSWCRGRARQADGWRTRSEILKLLDRVGADTWEAQHLCLRPDARSLIYAPFSSSNISTAAEYVPGAGPILYGYDWGYTDPTHIVLAQYRDGAVFVFDELTGSGRSEREWVRDLIRRVSLLEDYDGPTFEQWADMWDRGEWPAEWPEVWPTIGAGDPSAVQFRAEARNHGLPAASAKRVAHRVVTGQDVLRAAILTAGERRRWLVHPRCSESIKSFQAYRARELSDGSFSPEPDPDPANHTFSHGADASRYLAWRLRRMLGLGGVNEGTNDSNDPGDD